ncbi:MAG: hypothetical protein ACXVEF_36470 [Polyangiales bacterium]
MRHAALCLLFLVACSRPTQPMATPDPATAPPAPPAETTGRALFCAYGGVGIVPSPMPPDFEAVFTSVTIDLDQPGPASSSIVVKNVELLDAAGKVAATMRRVTELVKVDAAKTPPGRNESGSWAFFLNPTGEKFDGTLPKGRTRLRIRASLNLSPAEFPSRVRVTIGGLSTPLVVEGEVWGVWPT